MRRHSGETIVVPFRCRDRAERTIGSRIEISKPSPRADHLDAAHVDVADQRNHATAIA